MSGMNAPHQAQPIEMRIARLAERRASHVVSLPLPPTPDLEPPEWVELVPAGTFSGRDGRGPFILDIDAVLAAFVKGGIDLPIDYDHQTLDADAKAGPVPAAGWIKELQARDGALWGRVEWTPRAAELIANKEYRYLSPVFRHDKKGRVLALEGAGLTHYPNLYLQPVAHTKGDTMDITLLAEALGAATDADLDALVAHAKTLKEAASRPPNPAEWVPMSQHQAVAEELAKLQAEIAAEKAEAAVRAAMSAGKLAPAMKEWALEYAKRDPAGFAAFVEKAPVIVSADAPAAAHSVASNADTLTDEERYVCAALGISESDFAAHKRAVVKE